jgi:hypothetical protein
MATQPKIIFVERVILSFRRPRLAPRDPVNIDVAATQRNADAKDRREHTGDAGLAQQRELRSKRRSRAALGAVPRTWTTGQTDDHSRHS